MAPAAITDGGVPDTSNDQGGTTTTCNATADCANGSICRVSDHVCLAVTTTECPSVVGDYRSDGAILLGAILPTPLSQPPEYLKNVAATATSMQDAITLAVGEFGADQYKGLPPRAGSTAARPLAFVLCSDDHSTTTAATAAKHLATDLGVQAIVGTAFSTFTRAIAESLVSQGRSGVLLLTPRSDDVLPGTDAGDASNAWRLAMPDAVQGTALSGLVENRAPAIAAALGGDGGATLRVALVSKADAYGTAVAGSVKSSIQFNGTDATGNGPNFHEFNYGDSDAPDYTPQFPATALGIVTYKPHVVIVAGTNEVATSLIPAIESGWTETSFRPHYFFSDGVLVPELWQYLASNDPTGTLRVRILGLAAAQPGAPFNAYENAFAGKFGTASPIVTGAPQAYDAVYLLAYSAVAIGTLEPTGPNLAQGFAQLGGQGGALAVNVGPDEISSTFSRLATGQSISLQGLTAPLQLQASSHGLAMVRPQVWCIPNVNGTAGAAVLSGQYVDSSNVVQGTFTAQCGQ